MMDVEMIESAQVFELKEPAQELERPRIFRQPRRPPFARGKAKIDRLFALIRSTTSNGHGVQAYEDLLEEYEPALRWALASWDFLLSTEGYRYLLRTPEERMHCHGDYRTFVERDFSRLVHRTFRRCVQEFTDDPRRGRFTRFLEQELWSRIRSGYGSLRYPHDPRQRLLTDYSYLRCTPYQFLNQYHQTIVTTTLAQIEPPDRQLLDLYFLRFFTDDAIAAALRTEPETIVAHRRHALTHVGRANHLTYALLQQIERY
jgi:hypothetical protein